MNMPFPDKLLTTHCIINISEGMQKDGSDGLAQVFDGKCYHNHSCKIQYTRDGKKCTASGAVYIKKGIYTGNQKTISGEVIFDGDSTTHDIGQIDMYKNPGTELVLYTRVLLI